MWSDIFPQAKLEHPNPPMMNRSVEVLKNYEYFSILSTII